MIKITIIPKKTKNNRTKRKKIIKQMIMIKKEHLKGVSMTKTIDGKVIDTEVIDIMMIEEEELAEKERTGIEGLIELIDQREDTGGVEVEHHPNKTPKNTSNSKKKKKPRD